MMKKPDTLTLGTPVTFNPRDVLYRTDTRRREWRPARERWPWRDYSEVEDERGIVVGYRTLHDGQVVTGFDEPNYLVQDHSFRAVILVTSLYTKPIRLRPESVRVDLTGRN